MKKLLACLLIAVTAVTITACGSNPAGISLEEFDKIDMGTELSTVESIVGGEGTLVSEKEVDTDESIDFITVYKFEGETGGYAEIEFTKKSYKDPFEIEFSDPEVSSKTQDGLS